MYDFTTKLMSCLANRENMEEAIQELFRSELEKAMNDLLKLELTSHLNYERYERSGLSENNSRNGSYERKLQTTHGELNLVIPRDRNGEFDSPLVPKYERRDTKTEDLIVKLFQTGLTNAEISEIVESLYEKKYSRTTISNITERIVADVEAFRKRTLSSEYAVVYLDATYVPLRRDTVRKEAVHIALGITMEGVKEMLGYAVAPNESSTIWKELLLDIRSRGLKRPLLFVTDGITGIEETIQGIYPQADVQRCLVHVMRNIASHVRVKDRAEILGDFKQVHMQKTREAAQEILNDFSKKWKPIYPRVLEGISGNSFLLTFYSYPEDIRSSIYSTNLIENFNKHLKRDLKAKIQFPSEESMEKFLVSRFDVYNYRFSEKVHRGFGSVHSELNQILQNKYKNKTEQ
ncbi:MAG: IS256 family transposase [Rhodospirillaceae bacterium]|jgi:transposase-like protein|nr:IS256 family transposase [Rhodospirillaceae bacterium]